MSKEKQKHNVNVGGDAYIDPHFKEITKTQKGITLIALIITSLIHNGE